MDKSFESSDEKKDLASNETEEVKTIYVICPKCGKVPIRLSGRLLAPGVHMTYACPICRMKI